MAMSRSLEISSADVTLRDRVFRSSQPYRLVLPFGRPAFYKSYSSLNLQKAYEAVQCGSLSIRCAAEEFGVPRSTLADRVSGRVLSGATSGPTRYLSAVEEEELVHFLQGCSSIGYGRSRKDIIGIVQQVVDKKGIKVTVTQGWWESFKKRHPEIVLRIAEPVSRARAICSSEETLSKYFEMLQETLEKNDLLHKPCQIFNTDETGMPLDPSRPLIAATKGEHHPRSITTGNKAQVTVLSCCSAAGVAIPPLVIFDRKALKAEMCEGEVPGTMYGLSENGWIDSELFNLWFLHHFLAHAPPARPLLLLLDGHSSHYNPTTINTAAEEGVVVFCLPPHTSHITQPLDKGCFGPLKSYWREECHRYLTKHPGKVVSRFSFNQIFSQAWYRGMTMQNIIAGFRCTGLYPLNAAAVLPQPQSPPHFDPSSLSRRSGLNFIPLYTPVRERSSVSSVAFDQEQILLYEKRFEEGYDVPDKEYETWKKMYHPSGRAGSVVHMPGESRSTLQRILTEKEPLIQYPQQRKKPACSRVLTSIENLEAMRAKEKKKKEEAEAKEQKRKEREERRKEKELDKQRKLKEASKRKEEKRSKEVKKGMQRSEKEQGQGGDGAVQKNDSKRKKKQDREETVQNARHDSVREEIEQEGEVGVALVQAEDSVKVQGEEEEMKQRKSLGSKRNASQCTESLCSHPTARNWIQCEECNLWFHCLCVHVKLGMAKTHNFHFICIVCASV